VVSELSAVHLGPMLTDAAVIETPKCGEKIH